MLDTTEIIPKLLYMGGVPSIGYAVRNAGFDVLVLCASEYQPPARDFPGVQVIHCPLEDIAGEIPSVSISKASSCRKGEFTTDTEQCQGADEAARKRLCWTVDAVVKSVHNGRRVLVTCL